ncbi:unnamed protein product [Adineta ricciae]|uniref:PiggyBac transposable element-derived protein domain-containing protein n=1 Tax=Adineta ricciae TaxID=249248 RepID=A0A815TUN2_ADIRI|nr:unnamed protein product [Adineta ricciae]CAF1659312.1 unnamed protein product [Adineta ricciae]
MNRSPNAMATLTEPEENASEDMYVDYEEKCEDRDEDGFETGDDSSEGEEDDFSGGEDSFEDDEDDSAGSDNDSQQDSDSDGNESTYDSENDFEDDYEDKNSPSSSTQSVFRSSWTSDFHRSSAQQFHPSKKRSDVVPTSPLQTFRRVFCDRVLNLILEQTNIYGKQKYQKAGSMKDLIDITKVQLEQFLGINIIMGYCRNPSIDSYWSTNASLRNEKISTSMSCKNFKRILGNLHLVDNSQATKRKECDKLYKVADFLNLLLQNFQTHFDLGEKLTIDEMMIKFKGRCAFKQYIKDKPVKRGYKVWALADASTGYIYNFEIYTGKSAERQMPLGEHVVWSLTRGLSRKFHHVYFDNFFTSPSLVERLLHDGIYSTGTLRKTRKGVPVEITRDFKMNRGDVRFLAKGPISVVRWMDRKSIYMLSSFGDPTKTTKITRKVKNGQVIHLDCPVLIQDYNYGKKIKQKLDSNIFLFPQCCIIKRFCHLSPRPFT